VRKLWHRQVQPALLCIGAACLLLFAFLDTVAAQQPVETDPLILHLEKQQKFETYLAKKLLPQETRYAKKLNEVEEKFLEAKDYANAQLIYKEAQGVEARIGRMKSLQGSNPQELDSSTVNTVTENELTLHASEARTLGSAKIDQNSLHLTELHLPSAAALWSLSSDSKEKTLAYHIFLNFTYQPPENANLPGSELKPVPLRWRIEEGSYHLGSELKTDRLASITPIYEQYLGALKVRGRNVTLKLQLLGAEAEKKKEDLWSSKKEKEAAQEDSASSPALPIIEIVKATLIPVFSEKDYSLSPTYLEQRAAQQQQAESAHPTQGAAAQLEKALQNKNYSEVLRLDSYLNKTTSKLDQSAAQKLLEKYQPAHWAVIEKISSPIFKRYLEALPRRGEQPLITELISHQRRCLQTALTNPQTWQFKSHLAPEKQIPPVSQEDPPNLKQASLAQSIYSGSRFEILEDTLEYVISLEGVECPPMEISAGHLKLWAQRLGKSKEQTLAFATEAAAFTRNYLSGETFSFQGSGSKDLWGSHQGVIQLQDLPSYAEILVSRGLALVSNQDPALLQIQEQAKEQKQGLWGSLNLQAENKKETASK